MSARRLVGSATLLLLSFTLPCCGLRARSATPTCEKLAGKLHEQLVAGATLEAPYGDYTYTIYGLEGIEIASDRDPTDHSLVEKGLRWSPGNPRPDGKLLVTSFQYPNTAMLTNIIGGWTTCRKTVDGMSGVLGYQKVNLRVSDKLKTFSIADLQGHACAVNEPALRDFERCSDSRSGGLIVSGE
jgi:hypothetical protein